MNNNKSKKRIAVRLAILMMALALITSCLAVGTLSKYTVGDNGADKAQVAKWGVRLTVTGDENLFVDKYDTNDETATVIAQGTYDLVAPGTKNTTGATFTISGKPEVETNVDITLGAVKDVYLNYDVNGDDSDGKEEVYNPVVFTLVHTWTDSALRLTEAANAVSVVCDYDTVNKTETITGTLADIEKVLAEFSTNYSQFNPNNQFDDSFTLTWAWVFETGKDDLDTILGDLAADPALCPEYTTGEYCLDVEYALVFSVVQVD